MGSEIKQCQICKQEFIIDSDDFAFYEKMRVSAPTLCPSCRLRRRLAWRNEVNLYKRECDLCHKNIISMYPPSQGFGEASAADAPFPVYCSPCWWSDNWSAEQFNLELDINKNFLDQLRELQKLVPHEAMQAKGSVGSEYANFTFNSKNVYLSPVSIESENCAFCRFIINCKECVNCEYATGCEECVGVSRGGFNSRCTNSMMIENCREVHYSDDCHDCESCFGCINLRHKKFCIFNQEYSQKDYENKVAELRALPYNQLLAKIKEFKDTQIHRAYIQFQCQNVSGEDIYYAVNCKHCAMTNFGRDCAYLFNTTSFSRSNETVQNLYDCSIVGDMILGYEMLGGSKSYDCAFGIINDNCVSARYSMFCYGCTDILGCIGLRNKSNCILNREYPKEKYLELKNLILAGMAGGSEFFPVEMTPFAYNETMAQEYFPLSAEEAGRLGYKLYEREKRDYKPANDVVLCEHKEKCSHGCTGAFKIIPLEKDLYEKLSLPAPTTCPNCRRGERLERRNPLKLWRRKCMNKGCDNEFDTMYAPENPDLPTGRQVIIYCEKCYNLAVV